MDECLPAIIRDNKYFMYPFYYIAYRGKNIGQVMNLKSLIYDFTEDEYNEFYNNLNSISRNRTTDLNRQSLTCIIEHIDPLVKNLADIGCGNGYLLKQVRQKLSSIDLYGVDVQKGNRSEGYTYIQGNIEHLPFPDKSFDVVTCCHTLEHIINLDMAVLELKRITRRLLIIVIPRQRPYYYTLDEHVNFFPYKEKLTSLIGIKNNICKNMWGDWVYLGYMNQ